MPPTPEPVDDKQARQHLATLLLDRAVHVTYAVDRMEELATLHLSGDGSGSDENAAAQLADAIAIMTHVRTTLIHHADQLSEPPPP